MKKASAKVVWHYQVQMNLNKLRSRIIGFNFRSATVLKNQTPEPDGPYGRSSHLKEQKRRRGRWWRGVLFLLLRETANGGRRTKSAEDLRALQEAGSTVRRQEGEDGGSGRRAAQQGWCQNLQSIIYKIVNHSIFVQSTLNLFGSWHPLECNEIPERSCNSVYNWLFDSIIQSIMNNIETLNTRLIYQRNYCVVRILINLFKRILIYESSKSLNF